MECTLITWMCGLTEEMSRFLKEDSIAGSILNLMGGSGTCLQKEM